MTTKTETLAHQYEQFDTSSTARSQNRRSVRGERIKQRNNRLVAVAAAGLVAAFGALELNYYHNLPPMRTVPETVQPKDYENPSLVAGRAEQEFGSDPADFDIQSEALRIAHKYGQLFPGEKIQVQVR